MLCNIELERIKKKITKKDLADRIGIDVRTYYNWIDEKTDITGKALLKLSKIFGVSIEYLMEGCEETKSR